MQDQQLRLIIEAQDRARKDIQALSKDIAKLEGDTERLGDESEKTGNKVLSGVGSAFKKAGAVAVAGLAVAAGAVAGLAKQAVSSFADFEQLSGGMQKIFDEVDYSSIAADAQNAYKTMNISANQYMEQIAGVGAMFAQTMGDQAGYDTAKRGMQAIADFSSGTGRSVNELMEKFQAINKSAGTYQSIADQFAGILPATSKSFLEQSQAAGLLDSKYKQLTEVPIEEYQMAVTAMIEKGVGDMGLLGNTIAETENTMSGSINAMKASWSNLITGLADENANFEELLQNMVSSVGSVLKNVLPVLKTALGGIANLIKEIAPLIVSELPALVDEILPPLLEAAVNIIVALVQALPSLIQTIFNALVKLLPTLINALVTILPMLMTATVNLIITMVKKLTEPATLTMLLQGAIQLFLAIVQAIPEIVLALVDALPQIIDSIIQWLTNPDTIMMLINAAVQLFMGIVTAIPKILGALIGAFGSLFGSLWNGIVNIFSGLGGKIAGAIQDGLKAGINGILGIIEGAINLPFDLINGAIDIINLVPGVSIGKIPRLSIPRLATGNVADEATLAIFGEYAGAKNNPEITAPQDVLIDTFRRTLTNFFGNAQASGGGSSTTNINNQREVVQNFHVEIKQPIDMQKFFSDAGYAVRTA